MLRTIFAIIIFSCSFTAIGQDLHYSYYQFTPLTVNPALAGAFSGSYRINGIYSQKQTAISGSPGDYNTFTLSADSPIIKGLRKRDWIGVGLEMTVFDGSGLANFTDENPNGRTFQNWNVMKLSLAYHLALDKKQSRIITFGAQYGNNNRTFARLGLNGKDGRVTPVTGLDDQDIAKFNARLDRQQQNQGTNNRPSLKRAFKDAMFGLLYNQREKNSDLKVGFAVEGITRPKSGAIDSTVNERKYLGLNIHAAYDMTINKQLHIVPGAYYYSLGPANGLNINTHAHYKLNPEKDLILKAGLGLRNFRAIPLYFGAQVKGIDVGLAIDLDISNSSIATDGFGGIELAASYMGLIYKKPKVKPEIFCPRL